MGSSAIGVGHGANSRGNGFGSFAICNGRERDKLVRGGRHLCAYDSERAFIRKRSDKKRSVKRFMLMHGGAGGVMTLCCVFLLCLAACDKPDSVQQEVLTLRNRIRPPGATLVEQVNLVRNHNSAITSWEYETDWDWKKYTEWVSDSLAADYNRIAHEGTRLQFRRSLRGDVFELQIDSSMPNGSRKMRVQFRAFPN